MSSSDPSKALLMQHFLKDLVRRVVRFRRVCCELLSKGRQRVVTWRITARGSVPGLGEARGEACLGMVTLTEQLETAWD